MVPVRRAVAALAALAACGALTAGCGDGAGSAPGASDRSPSASDRADPPTSPKPKPSRRTPAPTQQPDRAARLSPAQKVGQLFMTGADATGAQASAYTAISTYHVGNVMLTGRSSAGVDATRTLVRSLRHETGPRSTHGIDLFVATDQEGGQVQVLRGPGFSDIPSGLEQGDLSPAALRTHARHWGRQLRHSGVDVNLAPVADTVPSPEFAPRNAPIGAFDREFGFGPRTVASHTRAYVRGMADAGVAAVVKHFPGLGRVAANTDTSSGVTDDTTTRHDPYLAPFRRGIQAGAPFVMVSTAVYTKIDAGRPAAFSPAVIQQLLRQDLGFEGVVISDDLSSAEQVAAWSPGERAVRFIDAGGDMVLAVDPADVPAMTRAVLHRYRHDDAFAAEVDSAVDRVLAAKQNR